jgi:hypothetical protein
MQVNGEPKLLLETFDKCGDCTTRYRAFVKQYGLLAIFFAKRTRKHQILST